MTMRIIFGLALTIAGAASAVQAQRFTGTVLLPDRTTPAAGVLVVAQDSTGRDVAQTVTLDDGSFALFVDSGATMTLRMLRVGFAPTASVTRRLGDAESMAVRTVLSADAVTIDSRPPRRATTCGGGRSDGSDFVDALLTEARKAMRAAQFRLGRTDATARYATFQHRTAKNGEDTLYTMMRRVSGPLPILFQEVTTDELETNGFFATIVGERVFRAPELGILASPWFTGTHCFTLESTTADEYVMRFAPVRVRKGLVDISGEYRLDRRTFELRLVTFHYVGLPSEERNADAGGVIQFARTPNQNWVVVHWNRRFPLLGYRQTAGKTTFVRSSMTLIDIIGHRTVGGRVMAMRQGDRLLFQRDAVERPASASEFARLCPERLVTAKTAAARGQLVADDSLGVEGVTVRATWSVLVVVDRTRMDQREHVRETVADGTGAWVLCDIPVDRDVAITWDVRGNEVTHPLKVLQPNSVVVIPSN